MGKGVVIGSCNGLPVWGQAITWTNTDLLTIRPLDKNFNEIQINNATSSVHENESENAVCKMVAILCKPQYVIPCICKCPSRHGQLAGFWSATLIKTTLDISCGLLFTESMNSLPIYMYISIRWNANCVIMTTFRSLAAPEVIIYFRQWRQFRQDGISVPGPVFFCK